MLGGLKSFTCVLEGVFEGIENGVDVFGEDVFVEGLLGVFDVSDCKSDSAVNIFCCVPSSASINICSSRQC